MDFRDVLSQRRMVRNYTAEPVPPDAVDRIVETVRRAPSAGFSQGQRLVVVTDPETRRALADALHDAGFDTGGELWLESAPVHVVVCTREADYHERYGREDKLTDEGEEIEWPVPFWYVDAGAAAMLLLLAAIDEGLGAGLFGVFGEAIPAVRRILALPDDVEIVAYVTIGHAAPDPVWSARSSRSTQRRRGVDELVHRDRWGG